MTSFKFSSDNTSKTTFSGHAFYNVYKDADFLRVNQNVEDILGKGYQLRKKLKELTAGKCLPVEGMYLERNTPLLVKKTGENVIVEDYEFTHNRLTGLTAAYAYENCNRFPILSCSEASALGLTWDNGSEQKCKLYLSAVSGTEHFYDQFSFWPLICALRKYQLNKLTIPPLTKIAKKKHTNGETMAQIFMKNQIEVGRVWKQFPGSSDQDLKKILNNAPPELKRAFLK